MIYSLLPQIFPCMKHVSHALVVFTPLVACIQSVRVKAQGIPAVGLTKMVAKSAAVAFAFSLVSKCFEMTANNALYIGYFAGSVTFCVLTKGYEEELEDEEKQDEYLAKYPILCKIIKHSNDIYFGNNNS